MAALAVPPSELISGASSILNESGEIFDAWRGRLCFSTRVKRDHSRRRSPWPAARATSDAIDTGHFAARMRWRVEGSNYDLWRVFIFSSSSPVQVATSSYGCTARPLRITVQPLNQGSSLARTPRVFWSLNGAVSTCMSLWIATASWLWVATEQAS